MKLKIVEKCLVNLEPKKYALRTYQYQAEGLTLTEALYDYKHNYNSGNIIDSTINDEFEGECLDSEEISVEPVDFKPMRVLIRKDALQIMSREVPAHCGYSSYQFKFREMIGQLEGTWVEVETNCLFQDQLNTVPLEGISESGLRIMENIVQEIENDKRVGRARCQYCGKNFDYEEECPHCHKSEYIKKLGINKHMPLVIRYKHNDTIYTLNCIKWDEYIEYIDSHKDILECELIEVRRYGNVIYKDASSLSELYKIRTEEV